MDPIKRLKEQAESALGELLAARDRLDAQIEPLRQKRAEIERQIAAAQGVIERFLSPDEVREQRRTIQSRILAALADAPMARRALIQATSLSPTQMNNALTELQKFGRIKPVDGQHGYWRKLTDEEQLKLDLALDDFKNTQAVLDAARKLKGAPVWDEMLGRLKRVLPMQYPWFERELRKE